MCCKTIGCYSWDKNASITWNREGQQGQCAQWDWTSKGGHDWCGHQKKLKPAATVAIAESVKDLGILSCYVCGANLCLDGGWWEKKNAHLKLEPDHLWPGLRRTEVLKLFDILNCPGPFFPRFFCIYTFNLSMVLFWILFNNYKTPEHYHTILEWLTSSRLI